MKQKQEKIKETMKTIFDDIAEVIQEKGECDIVIGKLKRSKPFQKQKMIGVKGDFIKGKKEWSSKLSFKATAWFLQKAKQHKKNKK